MNQASALIDLVRTTSFPKPNREARNATALLLMTAGDDDRDGDDDEVIEFGDADGHGGHDYDDDTEGFRDGLAAVDDSGGSWQRSSRAKYLP